jgi:hypothetical protein
VFPVQAFFASLAVALVAADSRSVTARPGRTLS